MRKRYLFIDRDGTLIDEPKDTYQIDSFERLKFEKNVIPALIALKKAGFSLVMVSNQNYLGSDSLPWEAFRGPHQMMLDVFESAGVIFDEVLICPHGPDEGCECRKPKTGLVKAYLAQEDWDRENSYVIGDRLTDLELASNMGIQGLRYGPEGFSWDEIVARLTAFDRKAKVVRVTKETDISVEVFLDREGENKITTGIGFFDHMLEQIATHAAIRLVINAKGDTDIDDHHTVEDVGLVLGQAIKEALGDKRGIGRFGFVLPMDECLAQCAMDISGRPYLTFNAEFIYPKVGELSTQMIEHFFRSLSQTMGLTLNLNAGGVNDHHKAEALFKVFARAFRMAKTVQSDTLPTSKGVIE